MINAEHEVTVQAWFQPEEMRNQMSGIELIDQERSRQVTKGFDSDHDDQHDDGSIAACAGAILEDLQGGTHITDAELENDPDAEWYDRRADHVLNKYGDDPIKRLTIAGALIVAEIERLQRKESRP